MAKLKATFVNGEGARLTVFAKSGKRGVNVAASLKEVGAPASTGCRSTHQTEEEGTAAFNDLKASAIKNGWVATVKKDRNAFSVIPMASGEVKAAKKSKAA